MALPSMDEKSLTAISADPLSIEEGKNLDEEEIDRCCCLSWKPFGAPPTEGCFGLKVEERPDLSVSTPEDNYVLLVPLFFAVIAGLCYVIYLTDPVRFAVLGPPADSEGSAGAVAGLLQQGIMFPLGLLVWYKGWSVAFTRKIIHVFGLIVIPAMFVIMTPQGLSLPRVIVLSAVWNSLSLSLPLAIMFLQPVRKWVYLQKISFASLERSDDRPWANLWMVLQSIAGTMVQTPMIEWMLAEQKGLLIWIPIFAVGLGDGLAEPVGRMWGKHKYEVTALFSSKKYTRSYEGSACVFFFTFLAVLIGLPEMNWLQAALCILTIPIANTVAEAKSPHTFDNHFMMATTWFLLWLIFDVLPTQ